MVNSQPVSLLISLGKWCRARYQIDIFMSRTFKGYCPKTFFFDSLQAGGGNGVINILERGFKLRKDDIEIYKKPDNGRYIPRDSRSGFEFLHDFGSKNKSFLNHEDCAKALSLNLDDSLAKYNYLGEKMDSILYSPVSVGLIYEGALTEDLILKLDDVLTQRYKKKIQIFNILDINEKYTNINKDNFHVLTVNESDSPKNGTFRQWEGNDASWVEAFAKINFRDVVIGDLTVSKLKCNTS